MSKISKNSRPISKHGNFFDFQDSFSVDHFLHSHRNAGSLEQMRDDLGLYLKDLRSAMIELINHDYQDFVNLSAELVDLDKKIDEIRKPIEMLRDEILQVRGTLTANMDTINDCVQAKKAIFREEKCKNESEAGIKAIDGVRRQLEESDLSLFVLERMALNVVQVQHTVKTFQLEGEVFKDTHDIQRLLLDTLNKKYLRVLEENDLAGLEKCLEIYAMLNEYKEAECVFR